MADRSSVAKLAEVQRRLHELQSETAALGQAEGFAAELAVFEAQVAELEVAHEELELQNAELMATREALERERHRYISLFEEAPFGYLVTDLHGIVEEANRIASVMTGLPGWSLVGKPLAFYLQKDDDKIFRDLLARARAGETPSEVEVHLRPRKRPSIPVMLAAVRDLDDQQRAVRLRWTLRNVSQQREAEEALRASEERLRHAQRLESVGRLAGGIAHSFNNLLAAIAFQCELLGEKIGDDDPRRAHVEEIRNVGERAAGLARQLLAFGRKQVLQPRVLGLNGVIRDLEPMLRRLIGEHIRLETRLDPAESALHVDFGQLEQVILNLVVNARDAMPAGGTLEIATRDVEVTAGEEGPELPPGPYIELSVADTGTGIAPEVLDRLFEPFFTTKERGHGTGLGLATVHGIVHQSGGSIRAESEPGQGSRFSVLLPRTAARAEEIAPPAARRERRAARGSEAVLLVEDEDNIREPACEILESRGYRVLAARDASQALALAAEHREIIHILVTDVIMPGLSGDQLAQQLSALRPEMRVLYISGYPEDSILNHGVLSPTQYFLQKPFSPTKFLEKVREVLDERAAG